MEKSQQNDQSLKAVVVGASGAVGRELVLELLDNPRWSEITIITRRILEEWEGQTIDKKNRLKFLKTENFDDMADFSKFDLSGNYNTMFCCLGTTMKQSGKEGMLKVDLEYPQLAAKLALHYKIPQYSLVSSVGANKDSCFFYMKTKGQVEDAIQNMAFDKVSIFRPGFLKNRRNDKRCVESCMCLFACCITSIDTKECGRAMMLEAELQISQPLKRKLTIYGNNDMKTIANQKSYPKHLIT